MISVNKKVRRALFDIEKIELLKIDNLPTCSYDHSNEFNSLINDLASKAEEQDKKARKAIRIKKVLIATIITIATLATLVACVKPLRDFIIEVTEKFTYFSSNNDDSIEDFKNEITEMYTFSIIPDDWDEIYVQTSSTINMVNWMVNDDYYVLMQTLYDGTDMTLDTENADDFGYKTINNIKYYYTLKNKTYCLIWYQYGYVFTCSFPESLTWDGVEDIITSLEVTDIPIEN